MTSNSSFLSFFAMFSRFFAFSLLAASSPICAVFTDEAVESSKIFGLSVVTAVTYGVLNDQVTARLSPEFFSKFLLKQRPDSWNGFLLGGVENTLEKTNSPTVVGLIWGVASTWWMGALLSVPLIAATRSGSWPKLGASNLVAPAMVALGGMGVASAVSGLAGYCWAARSAEAKKRDIYDVSETDVPLEKLDALVAVSHAHTAAYVSGVATGLGLVAYALIKRH